MLTKIIICVKIFVSILQSMVKTMTVNAAQMKKAAQNGFINATDLADYLTGKGVPFRTAYKIAGQAVELCIKENCVLETLPLDKYRTLCDKIDEDVYKAVDLMTCGQKRNSYGGTSPDSVKNQIEFVRKIIK